MSNEQLICRLSELPPNSACEFTITNASDAQQAFIINWQGKLYAYLNQCPHTGVNLNWMPGQFLDLENEYIQCGLHGALFRPDSGLCIHGPCLGQSLKQIPVLVDADQVYIRLN